MRTAIEYLSDIHAATCVEDRERVMKQALIDAMKEGMRRAAEVVVENNQPVFDLPTRLHTRQALSQVIRSAAEQLTEKDL